MPRWRPQSGRDFLNQLFPTEPRRLVAALEQRAREPLLLLVELDDFLLDGVLRHQAIHRDRSLLTHAVRAVRRLRFHGGVPPRIQVDHGVRAGQVQAEAACFQADQEQRRAAALEVVDARLTRRG